MLTIENRNKIVNHTITAEWFVEDITELVNCNLNTSSARPFYSIRIRDRTNKYFEDIHLYREKTKGTSLTDWYELSCMRMGKTKYQYLALKGIQNIKVLLNHIKLVGID